MKPVYAEHRQHRQPLGSYENDLRPLRCRRRLARFVHSARPIRLHQEPDSRVCSLFPAEAVLLILKLLDHCVGAPWLTKISGQNSCDFGMIRSAFCCYC